MKKRILIAALTAAMASSIFGVTVNAAERELNINWLSSRSASESAILAIQDIAKQYQEENPDLDFNFEIENISDRTAYLQKLKILAASDELPEWFDSDPDTWFADIVADGKAYSFEDLYKELGMYDQIFPISKEYARLSDGSLNLMTLQCNTEYFFYNKDLFEQAGITETPKTFDELLADCKLLQDQEIIPIAMGGDWPILRYFAQVPFRLTGNEYIENAVSGEGSFGEEAGLKGAQFIQDIAQYFQEGWSSADYDTMIDLFASGQAAIMYNGTWALDQADMIGEDENIKDNIGYFTIEAAYIDGCNWIQAYFFVKLPAIKNMFFVVLVILVNGCLKGFDVSYILTGGGPGNATELVATYMYKTAFSMSNFGYGSTLAVFILIESLIAVGIVKLIQKKFSD